MAIGLAPLAFGSSSVFAQPTSRPRLHAMIVGINTYPGRIGLRGPRGEMSYSKIRSLQGCINDARAIESAIKPIAATLHVLLDRDVTRARFLETWKQMVTQSSRGDTLLVTYSGHGGQENSSTATHTSDGLHDTFILSNFDSSQPGLNAERILDDEMQGLWLSVQGRNTVIFVADSCHAGGMTREADLRAQVEYRTPGRYDIEGDLGTQVIIPANAGRLELPHVVFLSGAQHNELVPEIQIDGRFQGALSLSFAGAIANADTNHDNVITGEELSRYVIRQTRAYSDSSQHPTVRWPQADVRSGLRPEDPLIYLGKPVTVPEPLIVVDPPAGGVRLQLLNFPADRSDELQRGLKGATVVTPPQAADLSWDAATEEVIDQLGNIVASRVKAGDLQAVVDRTHLIGLLRKLVGRSGIDVRLLLPGESPSSPPSRESDRRHKKGAKVDFFAAGVGLPNYMMFDIGGNGTIQVLEQQRNASPAPEAVQFTIEASEPFGADFLVTLASPKYMSELFGAIERLDGTRNCAALTAALQKYASGNGLRAGIQGVFTSEK
jgi:uncharacterized caspase-like protein